MAKKTPPVHARLSKQRIFLVGAVITGLVVGIVCLILVYFWVSYRAVVVKPRQAALPTSAPQTPTITPTPTPDPNRDFGVLMMGYGGGGHAGGYLTDTMILAYIQPKNEKITLISIPRDLWVPLQIKSEESKSFKINAAYAVGRDDRKYSDKPVQFTGEAGGGEMAKAAVAQVTGLNVERFATMSFAGFEQTIDVLGGVEVRVPVTFDDLYYPIEGKEDDTCGFSEADIATASSTLKGDKLEQFFTCRFEQLHFDAGVEAMSGERALKFVRSRHSAQHGGDESRTARQRALILAAKEQVFSIGFIPQIPSFIGTLRSEFQTDVDARALSGYLDKAEGYATYTISSLSLSTQNVLQYSVSSDRQSILIPKTGEQDWQSVHQFIREQLSEPQVSN